MISLGAKVTPRYLMCACGGDETASDNVFRSEDNDEFAATSAIMKQMDRSPVIDVRFH